mmetsp:Transcript_5146/g.16833  ORF Transcript_5146/g.16833 Transcript_5146/m.16833 type:complete len:219 (+) Transcript_5146:232-888(+)
MRACCVSSKQCVARLVYAETSGKLWQSLEGGRRMPRGSVASSGWPASTRPWDSRECGALPGVLLKSPATSMGMSADAAIFSSPLRRVCTCHSFTSLSSGLAWMCVLATQISCRFPLAAAASGSGGSSASMTTMSATLSLRSRLSAAFFCSVGPSASLSESAALLNSTSYFFTSAKRSVRKNVAQPSMAYDDPVKTSVVFFLYTPAYPCFWSSGAKNSV